MIVLQLGNTNWQEQFKLPASVKWIFNDPDYFENLPKPKLKKGEKPKKRQKFFNMVLVTSPINLTDEKWQKVQWKVDPYRVLYTPGVFENLSPAGRAFLIQNRAKKAIQDPQEIIADLEKKYFPAETGGFKMPPHHIILNSRIINGNVVYPDAGHLTVEVNSDHWQQLGSYRETWYIAPQRQMKVWLEFEQNVNVVIRLKVFAGQGADKKQFIVNLDGQTEPVIPLPAQNYGQFVNVTLEVRGIGHLTVGYIHGRWTRYGVGHYVPGGQRLVDPDTNEEIPYYFNPGDGRPPLNIYFAGVNLVENFEGKNMMRRMHAPSICFFDPRLSLGEFFVSSDLEKKIQQLIKQVLDSLNFTNHDLVVTGISEGSYAAVRIGAQLEPHAIIVGKLLANLGHIADRGRLHRPNDFQASYDIATRIINYETNIHNIAQLNESYWDILKECDLSHTKVFVTYMLNDNFDDASFNRFKETPAVKAAEEFAYKGYPGRHNDNSPAISNWFKERLRQVMIEDFGRRE